MKGIFKVPKSELTYKGFICQDYITAMKNYFNDAVLRDYHASVIYIHVSCEWKDVGEWFSDNR